MNADLTISTLTFTQTYSDKVDGSERREVSRGVNLPEILKIKHREYVDPKTKVPGVLSTVEFQYHTPITDGRIIPIIGRMTVSVPSDPLITSAMVLATVERFVNLLQEDDTGLDLMDEIFVSKQQ